MSRCRWDRDQEVYLNDGEPCRTDQYGDPTYHCRTRRSCGQHIGKGELTCARCIGRTRSTVRRIVELAPLALTRALSAGVNSDAANIAGPAADYRVFSARRNLDRMWIMRNIPDAQMERALRNLLVDDDDQHPFSVLTRWHLMLAEDYDHPLPDVMSISDSGAYLDRTLPRLAQDPEQDFRLFADEMRACLSHLETVLQNSMRPERGAPCPDCKDEGHVVRLQREYGHWCEDPECERFHHADESDDRWVCPRNRDHWRTHEDYSRWIEDRHNATA